MSRAFHPRFCIPVNDERSRLNIQFTKLSYNVLLHIVAERFMQFDFSFEFWLIYISVARDTWLRVSNYNVIFKSFHNLHWSQISCNIKVIILFYYEILYVDYNGLYCRAILFRGKWEGEINYSIVLKFLYIFF